jgi:hypothetical protein
MSDDTRICVCGHTGYWHGSGGRSGCEHDGECRCGEFTYPAEIHDACGRSFADHSEDGDCPAAVFVTVAAERAVRAFGKGRLIVDADDANNLHLRIEELPCDVCGGTGKTLYHGTGYLAELRRCSACADGRKVADTAIPNVMRCD